MDRAKQVVVFASMAPAYIPAQLHRATFRIAAVSFWALGAIVVGVQATGGLRSPLLVLYLVTIVFAASMLEFRVALGVFAYAAVASAIPPLLDHWTPFYIRSQILLLASMVICAFIPGLVRKALREENQLAEQRRLELEQSYLTTIEALATALDAKDSHTEAHSRETAALSRAVGRRLGLDEEALRFLEYAALLHDIGKIGIPGYILNKPGPLDADEIAMMREHPVIGERIVASVPFLHRIRPIVRAEHERWDGAGYPDGLKGEAIPIEARIIHACDALQAMSSDRPYRPAMPRSWIISEIRAQTGRQFDPRVADALLEVIEQGGVSVHGTAEGAVHEDHPLPGTNSWTKHLDAIQQLGARLSSVVEVPDVCKTIGETITSLLPYDQCRIYLLEDDGTTLNAAYFSDTKKLEYEGVNAETLAIQVGQGITGWVAQTKQGALVGDTERHPRAVHIPGTTESDESMLAVPVIFEERLIGVIVAVKVGLNQYTGDHLRLMTILANQAAVSIQNARLIERLAATARTDPLTGLANRRAFQQELDMRLAAMPVEPFTVIMLDVDDLKRVNDHLGHAVGDAVLKRVAEVLRAGLREADVVTRWGGDEFVCLLPGMEPPAALSMARRMRAGMLQDR